MNNFKNLLTLIIIGISTIGFSQENATKIHKGEVLEVIQVNSYTYIRISEKNVEKWIAVPTITAEIGDIYFYKSGMEMPNFKSNELDRTFDSVLFLQTVSKNHEDLKMKPFKHDASVLGKDVPKNSNEKLTITIESISEGISINELMNNKEIYRDKLVKIKGQVTKYNAQIMSKNWVHLQDGTDFNGEFDLTLTTNAEVNVGDIVVFEGKVSIDKDFGAGYFYKIIVENAVLIE